MEISVVIAVAALLLAGHKLFVPLLASPLIWAASVVTVKKNGVFAHGRNIFEKGLNFALSHFGDFKDRLCLKWIADIPSHHIRNFFYRHIYKVQMAPKVVIYSGAEIRNPTNLKIGKGSIIGDNAILDARAGIEIGQNVNFSSNVRIWTLQHDYRDPDFACTPEHYGPVKICDRAWIGPHTIILHDVTIGEGAVVGAGAVVTKDVPPYTLMGGYRQSQ